MTIVSTADRERLRHCILQVLPTLGECPEKHWFNLTLALISDVEQQENALQSVNGMIDATGEIGELFYSFLGGLPPDALPEEHREAYALLVSNFGLLRNRMQLLKEALYQMQIPPRTTAVQ